MKIILLFLMFGYISLAYAQRNGVESGASGIGGKGGNGTAFNIDIFNVNYVYHMDDCPNLEIYRPQEIGLICSELNYLKVKEKITRAQQALYLDCCIEQ